MKLVILGRLPWSGFARSHQSKRGNCDQLSSVSPVPLCRRGGRLTFFCFAKSKVSKRKGDPAVCVPPLRYGQPAVLGPAGVELELAALRQSRALIHLKLRSSAHTEGFCGDGFGIRLFGRWRYCFIAGVMREWLRVRLNVGGNWTAIGWSGLAD